ncbi:hypothetical protein B0H13DRAFT_1850145 [Mycena leptocephala]|nr:hypothetical protein B0H13DRAFT_1850145 [Mycena leptocephala]
MLKHLPPTVEVGGWNRTNFCWQSFETSEESNIADIHEHPSHLVWGQRRPKIGLALNLVAQVTYSGNVEDRVYTPMDVDNPRVYNPGQGEESRVYTPMDVDESWETVWNDPYQSPRNVGMAAPQPDEAMNTSGKRC